MQNVHDRLIVGGTVCVGLPRFLMQLYTAIYESQSIAHINKSCLITMEWYLNGALQTWYCF